LIRRTVPEPGLNWQFPGGVIESGETGPDAAVRETAEETALDVVAVQMLGERTHPATGRTVMYVACDVIAGTARPADAAIAEVAWCPVGHLADYIPAGVYEPVHDHLDRAT
jgi:8-oxo-dGTP diphosphatase